MGQRRRPPQEYHEDHSRFSNVNRIFGYRYKEQTLELTQGQHELRIETDSKPTRIWISFEDNVPGGGDKIGTEITDNGFILIGNIVSSVRTVRWFASLSKGKHKGEHRGEHRGERKEGHRGEHREARRPWSWPWQW